MTAQGIVHRGSAHDFPANVPDDSIRILQSGLFSLLLRASAMEVYPEKSPQANFLPGCWWCVSAMTVYPETNMA